MLSQHQRRISLNIVVAIDSKNGIGKDNGIPWYIPGDLKYFRDTTTITKNKNKKNILIMGRKTWDSIPPKYRPLPNRYNFILTRNMELINKTQKFENIHHHKYKYVKTLLWAFIYSRKLVDEGFAEKIFIIGGSSLYKSIIELPCIVDTRLQKYISKKETNKDGNNKEIKKNKILKKYKKITSLSPIKEEPKNELYNVRDDIGDITLYLTEIYKKYDCDTFLPKIDYDIYNLIDVSSIKKKDDIYYRFSTYHWKNNVESLNDMTHPKIEDNYSPRYSQIELTNKLDINLNKYFKNTEELQYLNIVEKVINNGIYKEDRTGTGTVSMFGVQMKFNLRNNTLPLLTTKRVFWKGIVEELLWFLRGDTDNVTLQARGVHIWDGNSSREFLDKLGFTERKVGDCGPIYGFQFRHCGAEYKTAYDNYTGQGIDQVANVINLIKNNPSSRRIIINLWNPQVLDEIVLPSCHCFYQFYVNTNTNELSCSMYQRSGDLGLGVPFNIASASLLTNIIASICNMKPGELTHTIGDAHVYLNHVEALNTQIKRVPLAFPMLKMPERRLTLEDLNNDKLTWKDFKLIGYKSYPTIKMKMAV